MITSISGNVDFNLIYSDERLEEWWRLFLDLWEIIIKDDFIAKNGWQFTYNGDIKVALKLEKTVNLYIESPIASITIATWWQGKRNIIVSFSPDIEAAKTVAALLRLAM